MLVKYILVWFLLAIVAILNGIVRQGTYGKAMHELRAHQISTVTAILATGVVVWAVNRFWPIESLRQAWVIGISWFVLMLAFEFVFGRYVAGHSWARLMADYNILAGRLWVFFLLWMLVMPFVIFKLG